MALSGIRKNIRHMSFCAGRYMYRAPVAMEVFRKSAKVIGIAGKFCVPGYRAGKVTAALDFLSARGKIKADMRYFGTNDVYPKVFSENLKLAMNNPDSLRAKTCELLDLAKEAADNHFYEMAVEAAKKIEEEMYKASALEYVAKVMREAGKDREAIFKVHVRSLKAAQRIDDEQERIFTKFNVVMDMRMERFPQEDINMAFHEALTHPLDETLTREIPGLGENMKRMDG